MADLFLDLPQWRPQVAERARALKSELASLADEDGGARAAIEARVEEFNSDWRELDRLIQRAVLARRLSSGGRGRDQLPPLLQYQRPCRSAHRGRARSSTTSHARIFRMLESGEIDGLQDRSYRRAVRSQGLSRGASGRRAAGRFIWSSRRSWRPTSRCGPTGRSRARPATTTPTLRLGCWWIPGARPPSRRPITSFAGEDQDFADGRARRQAQDHGK